MVGLQGGIGRVAERGDGAQHDRREDGLRDCTAVDGHRLGEVQVHALLAAGDAGAVEAAGVAATDGGEGERMGGLAGYGLREDGGCGLGDGPVEGEVAAASGSDAASIASVVVLPVPAPA